MKALLFPGQGARGVPEAVRAWRSHPLVEFARECTALRWDELEAEAGRAFERTEVLQPLLTAVALATHERVSPTGAGVVLGHSLGELAAACAGGAFDARTAVELAAQRGRLMAREATLHPGGLIAVTSRDVAPQLEVAAVNAADELVLGGLEARLPRGQKRVPVSGAWHTSAMAGAVDEFRAALASAKPQPLTVPLIRNLDGELTRDVSSLVEQLVRPVQFVASLQRLEALGVDTVVILGPGLVLRGLVRRTLATRVRVLTTEDAVDLERTIVATRSAP